jgi:hypothetical protein
VNKQKRILIVGLGAVGTNAAVVASREGCDVTAIHDENDIFAGSAANTAFIFHETGQEYCRLMHEVTGELCIAGAAALRLMFPMAFFSTPICNEANPIQFNLSKKSSQFGAPFSSYVPDGVYEKTVEHMRSYFTKRVFTPLKDFYKESYGQSEEQSYARAKLQLGCDPVTFAVKLNLAMNALSKDIVLSYGAVGSGINMPHIYAYFKAIFREQKIKQQFNTTIDSVKRLGSGEYEVMLTNGKVIAVDSIILAAGMGNPQLAAKIPGAADSVHGTYYLNAMVNIRLPENGDTEKILFTLQQEYGAALTCVDPISRHYVIYKPSEDGSQTNKFVYNGGDDFTPADNWKLQMQNGLELKKAQNILSKVSETYPVLKDAEITYAPLRVVFNPDSEDSPNGLDRRVRAMQVKEVAPAVFVTHGPKFTNSLLAALTTLHKSFISIGMDGLPVSELHGVGPENIDIIEYSRRTNFLDVPDVRMADAVRYALRNGIPATIIRNNEDIFHSWRREFVGYAEGLDFTKLVVER